MADMKKDLGGRLAAATSSNADHEAALAEMVAALRDLEQQKEKLRKDYVR